MTAMALLLAQHCCSPDSRPSSGTAARWRCSSSAHWSSAAAPPPRQLLRRRGLSTPVLPASSPCPWLWAHQHQVTSPRQARRPHTAQCFTGRRCAYGAALCAQTRAWHRWWRATLGRSSHSCSRPQHTAQPVWGPGKCAVTCSGCWQPPRGPTRPRDMACLSRLRRRWWRRRSGGRHRTLCAPSRHGQRTAPAASRWQPWLRCFTSSASVHLTMRRC